MALPTCCGTHFNVPKAARWVSRQARSRDGLILGPPNELGIRVATAAVVVAVTSRRVIPEVASRRPLCYASERSVCDGSTRVARRAAEANELIDRITVAGHCEPTLHPEFDDVSARLRDVRDRLAPDIPIAILSNSTTAGWPDVQRGLAIYDESGDDFFEMLTASIPTWSIEITLESPDEALRKRNGKFPWSNTVVEETIERALAHGCRKLDVFFMTGLPGQRYQDALAFADYCEHLLDRVGADGRLHPFVAPLGPFLDPGCRAFEQSSFGYTTFCRTLDDHRQAFLHNGWHKILSYETTGMTRDEIVRATYDVAERLNDLKHKHQLIDDRTFADVRFRLNMARQIVARAGDDDVSGPAAELANHRTMFGDDELKWPMQHGFRVGTTLLRSLAAGVVLELPHTAARLVGRYDVAPASASGR